MPKFFSIIVPSLNQPRFLDHCLKSVISQSEPSWELIVVDGGSGKEVMKILETYQKHFSHFISEPDTGQSDAVNKGLSLAKGTLVSWLNCDDFFEPKAFETIKKAFDRAPDRPFYAGNGYRSDENGKDRKLFYPKGFHISKEALKYGENEILQPATFINRSKFKAIGNQLDPGLHYALDTDLWIRLADLGEPLLINKPIATLREYEETKSAQGGWARFEEIRQVAEKYSGINLTPGALHVLAGTLYKELSNPELSELTSPLLAEKALELWEQTGHSLKMLNGWSKDLADNFSKIPPSNTEGEKDRETERLRKFIGVIEEDRRERGKQIERLTEVLVQSEQHRIDLTRDIEQLNKLIREAEDDRKARGLQVDNLTELGKKNSEESNHRTQQINELSLLLKNSENDRNKRLKNNDNLTQLLKDLKIEKQKLSKQNSEENNRRMCQLDELSLLLKEAEDDRKARGLQVDNLTELNKQNSEESNNRTQQISELSLLLKEAEDDRTKRLENNDKLTQDIAQLAQLLQELEIEKQEQVKQNSEESNNRSQQISELNLLLKNSENDRIKRLENNDKLTQLLQELEIDKQEQVSQLNKEIQHLRRPWYKKVAAELRRGPE